MAIKDENCDSTENTIQSGREIVADFIANLKKDPTLDGLTISVIDSLFEGEKLTATNLLKYLEEARGKTSV